MEKRFAWRDGATVGETLGPAMEIQTQEEADAYFTALLEWSMQRPDVIAEGQSAETVAANLRSSLGYYAGYYSNETRERVERLFHCSHPVFGAIAEKGVPTPEEAFEMGRRLGAKAREENE